MNNFVWNLFKYLIYKPNLKYTNFIFTKLNTGIK